MEELQGDQGIDVLTSCHFLRVPAEIRLSIYRYLLLPISSVRLQQLCMVRHRAQADEEGWVDEETDSDDDWSDNGCLCEDCVMERELHMNDDDDSDTDTDTDTDSDSSRWPDSDSDLSSIADSDRKIHLEILRVNSQIYREASSLFYAEAELVLRIDDILCLGPKSGINIPSSLGMDFNLERPPNWIWKFNPLKGTGLRDNGVVTYRSANHTPGGRLLPHVFARFKKLKFEIYFDTELMAPEHEMWIDDDTLEFSRSHAIDYQTHMERLPIIKDFAKLISNSPILTSLSITLEVDVTATSAAILRADALIDTDHDNDDEDPQAIELKAELIQNLANERAAELLVQSRLFDPLLSLSNIQKFNFGFYFMHREPDDPPYRPQLATTEKIMAMKAEIESNFKSADVSQPCKNAARKGVWTRSRSRAHKGLTRIRGPV